MIERAVVLSSGSRIGADLVPDHVRSSRRFQMPQFVVPPEGISFRDVDHRRSRRGLIESALEAAGGVQKRAAELLHIKPTTLNEMIKRHDIRPRRKKAANGSCRLASGRATSDVDDEEEAVTVDRRVATHAARRLDLPASSTECTRSSEILRDDEGVRDDVDLAGHPRAGGDAHAKLENRPRGEQIRAAVATVLRVPSLSKPKAG